MNAQGVGILPNDILACFDYLPNATIIKHGLDPANKEIPLEFRNTTTFASPGYTLPTAPVIEE
jgi:hypothetical protein